MDRFDQAVGQGWFILAIERTTDALLTHSQYAKLEMLKGLVLSVGMSGFDVTTKDNTYIDWAKKTEAGFAIIRPDFYVAAMAKTQEELRTRFDEILKRLGM
jgi:3-(3-hydroxy-phenyl)propionate hydroxylase